MAKPRVKFAILALIVGLGAVTALGKIRNSADDHRLRLHSVDWPEHDSDFGGMSGIEITRGGNALLAISDGGVLFAASLTRNAAGDILSVKTESQNRFLDNNGDPALGFHSDAEALRIAPDGRLIVAFEGYARVASFSPPDMAPTPLQDWDRFRDLWGNSGMEAICISSSGQIMAILERLSQGNRGYQTLVHSGEKVWRDGPDLATDGAFQATDADYGPDGRLYVLERDFSLIWGYTSRLSSYQVTSNGFSAPEILMQTAPGDYGNFEGLDVWKDAAGQTKATLISDNNFMPFSSTSIAEIVLAP